jgi:hypothetical protein
MIEPAAAIDPGVSRARTGEKVATRNEHLARWGFLQLASVETQKGKGRRCLFLTSPRLRGEVGA